MTTLSKRATPAQRMVLRMVEGAVRNAGHHHPHWGLDDRIARSIAKRAAGTLTAQWLEVLAASGPSDKANGDSLAPPRPRGVKDRDGLAKGERLRFGRRSPLHSATVAVGLMVRQARKAGETERVAALVDVLRLLAKITYGDARGEQG